MVNDIGIWATGLCSFLVSSEANFISIFRVGSLEADPRKKFEVQDVFKESTFVTGSRKKQDQAEKEVKIPCRSTKASANLAGSSAANGVHWSVLQQAAIARPLHPYLTQSPGVGAGNRVTLG